MSSILSQKERANPLHWITEAVNDAVVTADENGIILFWNKAAGRLFQYTAKEAIGKPLTIIVPIQYREAHESGIRRIVEGGEHRVIGKTVELYGLRKDGTEFPIELSLSTWKEENIRFFGGIIRDISARKLAEQQLKDVESRFHSLMSSANDAIISADEKGNIISWNNAAERMFGFEAEEVSGRPLTIIIPPEFRVQHEQGIARVSGGGEQHVIGKTVELFGLHKQGNKFPVELSLSTWEISGQKYF